jgi:hypothetical protein
MESIKNAMSGNGSSAQQSNNGEKQDLGDKGTYSQQTGRT